MGHTPGTKTVLKLFFNEEIHRVSITDVNFSELVETTIQLFPAFDRLRHQLKYVDEEGELISICSDAELEDALQQYKNKPLKVYVALKDKPVNVEQLTSTLSVSDSTGSSVTQSQPIVGVQNSSQELADADDLTALEEVQKQVAGEVRNLNESFQGVKDEELKKNFLKPLIDELFKALFIVTKTLSDMFEKKWISMKEFMEARVAFFREEMRKFKLKVRQLFRQLGDKLKGGNNTTSELEVEEGGEEVENLNISVLDNVREPGSIELLPTSSSLPKEPTTETMTNNVNIPAVVTEPIVSSSPPEVVVVPSTTTTVVEPSSSSSSSDKHIDSLVQQLVDMGFSDKSLNRQLIEKHRGDLLMVINELV